MIFKSLNNQNITKNNTGSLYTRTKCSRIKKPYTLDLFVSIPNSLFPTVLNALLKTWCIVNSSSNNLACIAPNISTSNCQSTIDIIFQLCTFCLQYCITTQFSAYPISLHESNGAILSLKQKCTYCTWFNAILYPCRFWYKPPSPHTTLPSTLTAPGSWTVARA